MAIGESRRFGLLLRQHRRGLRLTQAELAERAGYSVVYISMLERGARQPQAATVARLAEVLELSPEEGEAFRAAGRHAPPRAGSVSPTRGRAADDAPLPVGHYLGARPEGPLVGREAEWAELVDALAGAAARQGRLVLLAGEPGIGKTRLAQEVAVAARERGFFVASGRSYEPQRCVSYYPFVEALSRLHAAAPPELRAELPRRWPEAEHLLPASGGRFNWLAEGTESGGEEQRILWHISAFVQALAEHRPVALLLDDLHWADTASVDLLLHLARHTRTSRVLLLGTYRQQEVDRHGALEAALRDLGREGLARRLNIRRLPVSGTAALVASTLGAPDVPAALAELLHSRTDGNPFFTREIVRALTERGDLYRRDGAWDWPALDELALPESVRSLIGQRVERLSPATQDVLNAASVLGQTFAFGDIVTMGPHDEATVEAALEEAVAVGLIRERGRDGYAFDHALIQQTLYSELPSHRRRRLHLAAGKALERLPERARERRVTELAWHFSEADDLDRAFVYTLGAGEQAQRMYGYAEAERRFRTGVEIAADLDERREAEAREKRGLVLCRLGRAGEAMGELDRSAEGYRRSGDIEGQARVTAHRCHLCWSESSVVEEIARLRNLLAAAVPAGLSAGGQAGVHVTLAKLLRRAGRHEEVLTEARLGVELAREAGDPALVATAALPTWTALNHLGRPGEAARVLDEAVALAEAAGDLHHLSNTLNQKTYAHLLQGELAQAGESAERALQAAERSGDPSQIAFMLANRGEALFYTGDWARATADHERSLALFESAGLLEDMAFPMAQLGRLALARGETGEAERRFEETRALVGQAAHKDLLPFVVVVLAEWELLEGRAEAARDRLEPYVGGERVLYAVTESPKLLLAWTVAELGDEARGEALLVEGSAAPTAPQYRMDQEQASRVRAALELRQGRWEEAERASDEALSLSRAMGYPYAEAKALYLLGRALAGRGEPGRARVRHMEALAICGQLGERLYAGHIERALAELPAWHQAARRRVS